MATAPPSAAARGVARLPAWLAFLPAVAFLVLLARLWFDAPVWDDYDTILRSAGVQHDAPDAKAWVAALFAQHNDHRIPVTRLVAEASILLAGGVNFRAIMLLGNLALVGTFALAWREFRARADALVLLAAAALVFQFSHFEASLMASAAVPGYGVIFFAFACLACAVRPGPWPLAGGVAAGLLAAGSQTSGLLAFPLAAMAAFAAGLRARAAAFGIVAVALWVAHFANFVPPPHQPTIGSTLKGPVETAHLFLVMIGSAWHGIRGASILGLSLALALAILALAFTGLASPARRGPWLRGEWLRREWRDSPAPWWIAFLVLSMAAAAIARGGFGVHLSSRYAVYSSLLLALALLSFRAFAGAWRPAHSVAAAVAAIALNGIFNGLAWPYVIDRSFHGRLLAEPVPRPGPDQPKYFGEQFPSAEYAAKVLDRSAALGHYRPPRRTLHAAAVEAKGPAAGAIPAGHVDIVAVDGRRVALTGWSGLTAEVPGRRFSVWPAPGLVQATYLGGQGRLDVARHFGRGDLSFSGWRLSLEFGSEDAAQAAARALCVGVEAPGRPAERLVRPGVDCG